MRIKGKIVSVEDRIYKYEVGQIVDEVVILDKTIIKRKHYEKAYKMRCIKCSYTYERMEYTIKNGKCKCPCCANQVLVKGVNDLATTHPHVAKILKNKEEGYVNTSGTKKLWFTCPSCGCDKHDKITKVITVGLRCPVCRNTDSFAERFVSSLLKQCKIQFAREKKFEWSQGKRYDFYLPNHSMIIETHGEQHYKQSNRGRSLEEEQENDRIKYENAIKNGIEYYVIIDSRIRENPKDNLVNSKLSDIIKWEEVDFQSILDEVESSDLQRVVELYEKTNGEMPKKKMAEELDSSWETVSTLLHRANQFGLIDYKGIIPFREKSSIKVKVVFVETNEEKIFSSKGECSRTLKVAESTITKKMDTNEIHRDKYIFYSVK